MASGAAVSRWALAPLRRALASSPSSRALPCAVSKKLWGAVTRPSEASLRWSRLARRRPRAKAASASPSRWPARSAANMARAETPEISVTTEARFRFASSQTAGPRWSARARSGPRGLRERVRSRNCRSGVAGIKRPRNRPWRSHSAIPAASFTAGCRPGTALRCCAGTTRSSHWPASRL
jgi:hypothetical protein